MSAADTPPAFAIDKVSIGLNNSGHLGERTFAQASVTVGPFSFDCYLLPDGRVSLPMTLRDERLRLAISEVLREMVVEEAAERWTLISEYERRQFEKRQAERQAHRRGR